MATKKQVEDAIFSKEGFYVRLLLLKPDVKTDLPDYDFEFMAPNTWKLSDWKTQRLKKYVAFCKGIDVYRGNDTLVKTDVKLAHLRDSYYEFHCGKLDDLSGKVIPFERKSRKNAKP